ncbi:hypothetical protein [uncultured Rhodoferax sp.]|uniref:hypothetical protein n=1 Tax=uncultured Rhodoferax sp. TaxID=223188 RepID=UPI0025CEC699|nr:hypothetical protein [uncultured Rhodoferax sp.]
MRALRLWWALGMCGLSITLAQAQDRDPTLAPSETAPGSTVLPGAPGGVMQGSNVIVRNGQPHLVVGTRLVAVGQLVGNARLERITETEIWLRDGKQLSKVPRFTGIQRSPARAVESCEAKPVSRSKSSRKPATNTSAPTSQAPCKGVTP